MHANDMPVLGEKLNGLADVFGKQHVSKAALGVWWDTIKEFDHNEVFGVLGYWAQGNSRMPTPADVWKVLNERRTSNLEEKARQERLVNTGRAVPSGYHPTHEGKALFSVIRAWMNGPRRPIEEAILEAHRNGAVLPYSVLRNARLKLSDKEMTA